MLLQKIKNCSAYTGIAKFTGNSVGLMPARSTIVQVSLASVGNLINNFPMANGEITAIKFEHILRKFTLLISLTNTTINIWGWESS